MSIRSKLNNNPAIGVVLALGLAALSIGILVYQLSDPPMRMKTAYFYDTDSGEVFIADATMKPVKAPGAGDDAGPAGFRARIYACGDCGNYEGMTREEVKRAGATLAYVMKKRGSGKGGPQRGAGPLMSEPDNIEWVGNMRAGKRVTDVSLECKNPSARTPCAPSD